MNFNSNENKGMVWSILQENNVFTGIDNDDFKKVQQLFEKIVSDVEVENISIIDKNKKVMFRMTNEIKSIKNKSHQKLNDFTNNNNDIQMIYNSDIIEKQRVNEINNSMLKQRDEMNTLMQPKIPEEPVFEDNINDEPLGENMDILLKEMIASREKELEIYKGDDNSEETRKWLNQDGNNNVLISVEEKKEKKVNFSLDKETIFNNDTNKIISDNKTTDTLDIETNDKNDKAIDILSKLKRKTNFDDKKDSDKNDLKKEIQNKMNQIQNTLVEINELINNF
jgi:hypothetical protein